MNNGLVKVITGIRRCGKSYLMNNIFYDYLIDQGIDRFHIIKFAFDSAEDLELIGEDFIDLEKNRQKVNPRKFMSYIKSQIIDSDRYYLLLDEIQNLGSFESVVGGIANQLSGLDKLATALGQTAPGVSGYDMDGYMQGRQYYFGFQLGAAYKITPDLSVYGGLRLLYGNATYKAKISNIQVKTAGGYVDFGSFLQSATALVDGGISTVNTNLAQVNAGIAQYEAAGVPVLLEYINVNALS